MEIERKFLVSSDTWKMAILKSATIIQFYLTGLDQNPTIRLRIKGDTGVLTIKYPSRSDQILMREEFEYVVPIEDVLAQKDHAKGNILEKTRHDVRGPDDKIWEVDVFDSPKGPLIVAEIELQTENEELRIPGWAGREVTMDPRYSNLQLAFNHNWPENS